MENHRLAEGDKDFIRLAARLIFVDESGLLLTLLLQKTWVPVEQARSIRHRLRSGRISVIAGIKATSVRYPLGLIGALSTNNIAKQEVQQLRLSQNLGGVVVYCLTVMSETKNFREHDQSQGVFRTISPQELLEPEHPARILDAVVERLDLSGLYEVYSTEGAPAYHPKMMLKVLFYSYLNGTMSCRGMWDGLKNRADYIFLSGDQVPDFRTINRFRLTCGKDLAKLFSEIVHLCVGLGMVGFEHLAIDGQKIQANASFYQGMNKERYVKSSQRVEKGMQRLLGREVSEDFSEEVKQQRLQRLSKQKERLDRFAKEIEELEADGYLNLTDTDAAQMKHKDGRKAPSYNHQSAVDGKLGVTVAVETRREAFDHSQHLLPLVEKASEHAGQGFAKVMADSGFCDFEVLGKVEHREERYHLPDRDFRKKTGKGGGSTHRMRFNEPKGGGSFVRQDNRCELSG